MTELRLENIERIEKYVGEHGMILDIYLKRARQVEDDNSSTRMSGLFTTFASVPTSGPAHIRLVIPLNSVERIAAELYSYLMVAKQVRG